MGYPALVVTILIIINVIGGGNAAAPKTNGMPSQPIKLYYVPPSPPCRVVMMAAKVMGIELDLVLTDLTKGAHLTPEFLKMNPQHTVPTIDDNGFILWESRAIMAYWANAYGHDESLYPKNPRQRAIVDQRLQFDLGTLYARYLNLYVPMLFQGKPFSEENADKLKEALGWLNTFLEGHTFVAGNNMTLADISIVVTITNLEAFGFDISSYENITKWFAKMKTELEPYGYMEINHAGAQILAGYLKKQ